MSSWKQLNLHPQDKACFSDPKRAQEVVVRRRENKIFSRYLARAAAATLPTHRFPPFFPVTGWFGLCPALPRPADQRSCIRSGFIIGREKAPAIIWQYRKWHLPSANTLTFQFGKSASAPLPARSFFKRSSRLMSGEPMPTSSQRSSSRATAAVLRDSLHAPDLDHGARASFLEPLSLLLRLIPFCLLVGRFSGGHGSWALLLVGIRRAAGLAAGRCAGGRCLLLWLLDSLLVLLILGLFGLLILFLFVLLLLLLTFAAVAAGGFVLGALFGSRLALVRPNSAAASAPAPSSIFSASKAASPLNILALSLGFFFQALKRLCSDSAPGMLSAHHSGAFNTISTEAAGAHPAPCNRGLDGVLLYGWIATKLLLDGLQSLRHALVTLPKAVFRASQSMVFRDSATVAPAAMLPGASLKPTPGRRTRWWFSGPSIFFRFLRPRKLASCGSEKFGRI